MSSHLHEVYSTDERIEILRKMRIAANQFYAQAVRIHCHPFVEFTGLINEYIAICEHAQAKGIDFTQCNVHTGARLPIDGIHMSYINEKLGCIFSEQLKVILADTSPSDGAVNDLKKSVTEGLKQ